MSGLEKEKFIQFEWLHLSKIGEQIPVEVSLTALMDDDGQEMLMAVMRDVTDRKVAEQSILDSLKEKEMLLAEIHHRVKNNLAIVSGLIQLQMISNTNPEIRQTLAKSVNRIKSIALIHDQLYTNNSFSRISMIENIKALSKSLMNMYAPTDGSIIKYRYNMDEVHLDINQAIPLGLLVNEIVTNSLKHAFRPGENGLISIVLKQIDENILLEIHDDGIGFDSEKDFLEKDTLGKTLIETFVSQLDGELSVNGDMGATFEIRFKTENKKGASAYLNV